METVDLNIYNNSWYTPGPKWKILLWFLINPITVNTYLPIPQSFKKMILRLFGAKIADKVVLKPRINIKYPWYLEIGENTWIGEEVWIDNLVEVKIGKNACISQGAMLLTGNHDFTKKSFDLMVKKIELENGVWVGAKAIICPGVKMKTHSMLSAGSVLSKQTKEYFIYTGNPAIESKMRIVE